MKNFFQWVDKHFGLVMASALVIGLILGWFYDMSSAAWLTFQGYFISAGLILVMYLSLVKINLSEFFKDFKRGWLIFYLIVLKLIILPLIIWGLFLFMPEQYLTGAILVAAAPAAITTPGLLVLLKGDAKSGLILTVLTQLLVPFTLPPLLKFTIGAEISLDVMEIFIYLVSVISIPLILALLTEKFAKKTIPTINKYSSSLITLDIFLFVIMVVAPHSRDIISNLDTSVISFFVVALIYLLMTLFALLFFRNKGKEILATSLIILVFSNIGLMIAIATNYFDATTILMTIFGEFFWVLGLVPMQYYFSGSK